MLVELSPPWHTRLAGAGAAADCEGKTPLHYAPIGFGQAQLAAKRGVDHHAVAEVLLAAGCTADAPDSHGCTPVRPWPVLGLDGGVCGV